MARRAAEQLAGSAGRRPARAPAPAVAVTPGR
jgi:hypothetical protein